MEYIQTLLSVQTYVYQIGSVILIIGGGLGCILSLIIFSKKNLRKNPCSFYFIAYNFANLCQLTLLHIQGMLAYGYNINISTFNDSFCRIDYYLGYVLDILSPFYLILASIDRMLVTSRDARIRRHSTHQLAYKCIIGGTIVWMLIHSHTLIFFKVIEIIPSYLVCYSDSNIYLAFTNYYALVKTILIPIVMLICEVFTIKHIRSTRHATVAPVSTAIGSAVNPTRSKDRQLIGIVLINASVYIIFTLVPVSVAIYKQITQFQNKSSVESQVDLFLTSISSFIYYIPFSISFYTNLIVSKTFRKEIKNTVLCK
ncbi:hypothetical protein I4U23_004081 [Adineta vaga]|nr:hypothetical protein I4U23_004081 [Adineta vaga]